MGVRRVVPDLSSTSLEAAKGFYGDLLGLRPVMDHGWISPWPIPDGLVPRSAS
jgi:catechol 2,3-dioxygenase-like lactoylglutathione lyase family enzyme